MGQGGKDAEGLESFVKKCCESALNDQGLEEARDLIDRIGVSDFPPSRVDVVKCINSDIKVAHNDIPGLDLDPSVVAIDNLMQNLIRILEHIEDKETKRYVYEIYHFAEYESLRIGHTRKLIGTLETSLKKNFENTIKQKAEELENRFMGELEKSKTQYITILGIFAAVVMTFAGGLNFSSSVLANIDKAGILKLLVMASLIAMLIMNLMYFLMYSLRNMGNTVDVGWPAWLKRHQVIVILNAALALVLLIMTCKQMDIEPQKAQQPKSQTVQK